MRNNKSILAIIVGLMAAALSLHAIAKGTDKRPTPEQTSLEHCLLDGGETAQNKDVVACCVNGIMHYLW